MHVLNFTYHIAEFTAVMVVEGYERYIRPSLEQEVLATSATAARDLFVSGGGAHNTAIMRSTRATETSDFNHYIHLL